jgi:hypothetical protein
VERLEQEGTRSGDPRDAGAETEYRGQDPALEKTLLHELEALDADNESWRRKLLLVREAITHRIVDSHEALYTMVLTALKAQVFEENERLVRYHGVQ